MSVLMALLADNPHVMASTLDNLIVDRVVWCTARNSSIAVNHITIAMLV